MHLHSKFRKNANKSKNVVFKNSIWVSKNAESVETVVKKYTKKVLNQNVTVVCAFPLLLRFVKLVLLITFFVHFCNKFFTDWKSA